MEVSLSAALNFPTFSGQNGYQTFSGQKGYQRADDAFFIACVTKDVGLLRADFNAGVNAWGIDTSPRDQPFVALARSMPLPAPSVAMAEVYAFVMPAHLPGRRRLARRRVACARALAGLRSRR